MCLLFDLRLIIKQPGTHIWKHWYCVTLTWTLHMLMLHVETLNMVITHLGSRLDHLQGGLVFMAAAKNNVFKCTLLR